MNKGTNLKNLTKALKVSAFVIIVLHAVKAGAQVRSQSGSQLSTFSMEKKATSDHIVRSTAAAEKDQSRLETGEKLTLSSRQYAIVTISSFTAKGNLGQLNIALNEGLDSALTISEIKEVLVHLYAYCGFPRSLQGINTFISVIDERKAKGIKDKLGREATPVKNNMSKYQQGKNALETLTGQPEKEPKSGYAAFSPVIDTFLKEHLFADIFGRDVLSYTDREIATISALVNLGGVEPMMQSHMRIALNLGISASDLGELLSVIETKIGNEEADAGRQVLSNLTNLKTAQNTADTTKSSNIFVKGIKAPPGLFTGTVWLNTLVQAQDQLDCSAASVTFEPGARTNWHMHPGGQVLLVTEGRGYYQQRGQPIGVMKKGDVVKCPPGTEHWHGASPETKVTHIAISTNAERGNAVWLQRVTDEEYKSLK